MTTKLYEGKGKNAREAWENLNKGAEKDATSGLEGTVQYEVSVVGKRGKLVTGKAYEDPSQAFASALAAAKLNPDGFDSQRNPVEYAARGNYQLQVKTEPSTARQPSGSAPSGYSGKGLTDLF